MEEPPTDSMFLDERYERFRDEEWVALREQYVKTVDLVKEARQAIAAGVAGEDQATAITRQ